jgi:riboflavin kinase/FMN adenylyltransferase
VGENFNFGEGGSGNARVLTEEGKRLGFEVRTVPLVNIDGLGQVSSTLIRGLIIEGRAHDVITALGRPYTVTGKVVEGHSRGKALGFPTANLELERQFCVPPDGVYAGKARLRQKEFICAVNIGSNPTFGDTETALEVFLLDFVGDIYGKHLELEFHQRLREEKAFASENDLVRQMKKDVARARVLLGQVC